jgi:hypothetical protein
LGAEARVRPSRGGSYAVEMSFATAEEALEAATRLAERAQTVS